VGWKLQVTLSVKVVVRFTVWPAAYDDLSVDVTIVRSAVVHGCTATAVVEVAGGGWDVVVAGSGTVVVTCGSVDVGRETVVTV